MHFFYCYLRLRPSADGEVRAAVPCGAAGHLSAAVLAQQMGLPIRLLAATNANDALVQMLKRGTLRSAAVRQTLSPSMDIMLPYNAWRLLYAASGGDASAVARWQRQCASGTLRLPDATLGWLAERVAVCSVSDGETEETMRAVHEAHAYMLDPHTAVAAAAAARFATAAGGAAALPTVVMACAHP